MEMEYGGLCGIGENTKDYILTTGLLKELEGKNSFDYQPKYEYNQGASPKTKMWCTVYSCFTQLSYLFDREFSQTEIEEVANKMIADGKLGPKGAYLHDSIDYVRKWWNANNPDNTISSYRVDLRDKKLLKRLTDDVIRLIQFGYYTSPELFIETQTKGYADKKNYPKGTGHAVSLYGINIIDNYKGKKKFNRYSFNYFDDLVKSYVVMRYGYVFLKN